ncbi:MAG: hypothetical protein ABFC80_00390 [Coriobacteriales bacterium]
MTSMNVHTGAIFRVSSKLGKKIRLDYEQTLPPSPNPLLDWSADLFTADRTQYILLTNTASLYSLVLYGKGVTNETRLFADTLAAMRDVMRSDGFLSTFEDVIAPLFYPTALAKRANRSVIGSMNDLILQARLRLARNEVSPSDLSFFLNNTLMSYIDYRAPREDFRSMVRDLLAR